MEIKTLDEEQERTLLGPLAAAQMQRVRERDPWASFTFGPGPDRGIWVLDAYVTPPLNSDMDFLKELVEPEVDFQIEHGLTVATILLARVDRSEHGIGAQRTGIERDPVKP